MDMPMTSYPCSLSNAAAVDESTPPLMATTTRLAILLFVCFELSTVVILIQIPNSPYPCLFHFGGGGIFDIPRDGSLPLYLKKWRTLKSAIEIQVAGYWQFEFRFPDFETYNRRL